MRGHGIREESGTAPIPVEQTGRGSPLRSPARGSGLEEADRIDNCLEGCRPLLGSPYRRCVHPGELIVPSLLKIVPYVPGGDWALAECH